MGLDALNFPTSVKDKIKTLVGKVTTNQIKVYDSSKSSVTVAGMKLDCVVEVNISNGVVGEAVEGLSDNGDFFQERHQTQQLTIKLLPTSKAIDSLSKLYQAQYRTKGYIYISVIENGISVGDYSGYLITFPEITFNKKAENRIFAFVVRDVGKITTSVEYVDNNTTRQLQEKPDELDVLVDMVDEDDAELQHGRSLEADRQNILSDTTTDGMASNLMNNDISDY